MRGVSTALVPALLCALVSTSLSGPTEDIRKVLLTLPMACQHEFSVCGEEQNIFSEAEGNFCEAVNATMNCSLTSRDHYDEGEFTITGVCTPEEFSAILAAACPAVNDPTGTGGNTDGNTDGGKGDNSDDDKDGNQHSTGRDQVTINTQQQWDQLNMTCRNHTLTCFNLDPSNVTLVQVERSLLCPSLTAVQTCVTGNITAGEVSPCSVEEYNRLKEAACGARQLTASFLPLLLAWLMLGLLKL